MNTMTREEFMMKKIELENRMHQTRIDEKKAVSELNIKYDDLISDEQKSFREKRKKLMEKRDFERVEIENRYKQVRREIWSEDCALVHDWRAQMGDLQITPPPLQETGSIEREA